jgi:hypothetical protein
MYHSAHGSRCAQQQPIVEILKDGGFFHRATYSFETLQQGSGSSFMSAQGGSVKAQAQHAMPTRASTAKTSGHTTAA